MLKDLTKIADLTVKDVRYILALAHEFKVKHDRGIRQENMLGGKVVALVFEKPSLRTKVAFEVATTYLGGVPVFLSSSQILASGQNQRGRESIPDIGRNLERFVDLIVQRVYRHEVIIELAESITKPVINALCDRHHPTQALADLMGISLHRKDYKGLNVCYIGDGNNVATSLMQICALMGVNFRVASPDGYEIPNEEREVAATFAKESGSTLGFERDPKIALKDADVVYTDTFVSMGQEAESNKRVEVFAPYQVNADLMKDARSDALFMHCLPAHRGEEVSDEVMDSPQSIVFDQAECRLHIAKALLAVYLT